MSSNEKQTLVNLTQSFIKILTEANGKEVDLSFCERKLNTPKRRLYDIINVLSGVGLIQRLGKSKVKISEIQDIAKLNLDFNVPSGFNSEVNNGSSNSNIAISDREREIDMLLNKCETELKDLSESELFDQFAFITEDDISNIDPTSEYMLFSISGPKSLSTIMDSDPQDPFLHRLIFKIESGDGAINVQPISKANQTDQPLSATAETS